MDFATKLSNYADLIVCHGLNVQKGQAVNLAGEACHRDLLYLIAERAYARGARFVGIDLIEPRLQRIRILSSQEKDFDYVPRYVGTRMDELVEMAAAHCRLVGPEDPDLITDLDPRAVNALRMANYKAVRRFYEEGIGKSKVHWTIAAAATERWGKKVFPKETADRAKAKLWDEIFRICRVDRPDFLKVWQQHNQLLHTRAKWLTQLKIESLQFSGPGTDLKVGLSPIAVFKAGGEVGPLQVEFEPNLPSEECFTTPDWRETEGKVRTTRPFLINGKMIRGLCVEFKKGEIVSFTADEGAETFREYISSDAGGKRLGEVALVGIDSPIFQSRLVYEEILFDENAACHIAIGSAYKFCLQGGGALSAEELSEIGCNESSVHTDMMISNEEVNVSARCRDGRIVELIKAGAWVNPG